MEQTRCVYRHTFIKSKIVENVLRGPDLTHKVDKKGFRYDFKETRYNNRAKSAIFGVN